MGTEPFPGEMDLGGCELRGVLANLSIFNGTYDFGLSLFFGSGVNMAAPPEKFNVEEHGTVVGSLFLRGRGAGRIHDEMSQTLGDGGPSCSVGLSIFGLATLVLRVRNPVEGMFLSLCLQM